VADAIKVNDIVMVLRPNPCGCNMRGGFVFQVRGIERDNLGACKNCGFRFRSDDAVDREGKYWSIPRLRRIDPLSEPEAVEERKELTVDG
jgi:hypothetical protein